MYAVCRSVFGEHKALLT